MYYNTRQVNPISLLQSGIPEILDPSNLPPNIRPTIYESMNYLQKSNQYQTPQNNPSSLRDNLPAKPYYDHHDPLPPGVPRQ